MTREELITEIYSISDSVVIVGGTAQMYFGYKDNANDIDIVVKSLKDFYKLGQMKQWLTKSPYSVSGKRAYIERDDICIDIFIENNLPDYFETDSGIKYETVASMLNFYTTIYSKYDKRKQWKQRAYIQSRIDLLTNPKPS